MEKRFLEKDGLSRSALYGIVPDEKGRLWIPTIKGLTRFDPKNNEFKSFFVAHNLQSNEFNFNALWQEKDGSIILGGTGGITKFHPDYVDDQYDSKNPVISNIKAVNDELMEKIVLGVTKNSVAGAFVLEANQRSVILDFSVPEYNFQDRVKYEYRLVGSEEKWIFASGRDIPVRYANLAPGQYKFQVRTVDDSLEDNEIISVGFGIKAHLWEKLWFWFAVSIFIGIALFYIVKSMIRYRLERKMSQERSDLYGIVVHDLGPALKRSQGNLSHLIESPGGESHEVLHDLYSENQYALSFVEQLRSLSTIEGYSGKNEYEFLLEDVWDESVGSLGVNNARVSIGNIPDVSIRVFENSVQFVIKNLISNAIKYSESEKIINVSIQAWNKNLVIIVSDQGYGIKDKLKEKVLDPYERGDMYKIEGLGIGLTLVKAVAHRYNGRITIKDNKPKGSVVTVLLKNVVLT